MVAAVVLGLAAITASFGSGGASAKGGTAKPPPGNPAPLVPPTWPAVPPPVFSVNTADIHGFDVTGFVQSATVDPTMCPDISGSLDPDVRARTGGSLVVNGITVVVPCNSIVQMPANTLTWSDSIDLVTHNTLALDGTGSGVPPSPGTSYPSFEVHVVGNIVGTRHIAGLVFLSQQSANSGQGVITRIDYATGDIWVGSAAGAPDQVRLQINDPNGRFGRAQSPDDRFSVDDANPTIHSGTGYPMCVPRTADGAGDPLCPQRNRPSSTAQAACRNWTAAGVVLPAAGELSATPVGQRCRNFVMKDPAGVLSATDPDARQQAPMEVGDFVTYAGTLFTGAAVGDPDYISAHTIEVNVGIYTQPGTLPTYLAIGEFGVGSADPAATSVNGAAQEAQDRIFLEAETTDVKSPVDIYLVDVDPTTGAEINRWITPFEMTGENNGPVVPAGANNTAGLRIGGGITTQNAGAQVQRARLRATKAPVGVLGSPTRTLRVVSRTQCVQPKYILNSLSATAVVPPNAVADAPNVVLPAAARVSAIDATAAAGGVRVAAPCLESTPVANGLFGGVYTAPTFEYIFPENVSAGDPVVPFDLWHLGFLVNGEGPGSGPLVPTAW
jgi:hypothetical protein